MSLVYRAFTSLLQPISFCLLLLLAAAGFSKRKTLSRICFWLAVAVLLVCGNGRVVGSLGWLLECRYPPPDPVPQADCIVVLSGGTRAPVAPWSTVEIEDAGDRVLYGAYLWRQGKATQVVCTGGLAAREIARRSHAEDMADLLEMLGVSKEAITKETKARNTHEHATYLLPLLKERGFKRVLLVTSAKHMPRAIGVFKRLCPGIEFIAAPTDFRVNERISDPWPGDVVALIPTPSNLREFSELMHEYLGIAYYKIRGWM